MDCSAEIIALKAKIGTLRYNLGVLECAEDMIRHSRNRSKAEDYRFLVSIMIEHNNMTNELDESTYLLAMLRRKPIVFTHNVTEFVHPAEIIAKDFM